MKKNIIIILLVILTIACGIMNQVNQIEAEKQRELAELYLLEAEKQKNLAQVQADSARSAQRLAEQQRRIAEKIMAELEMTKIKLENCQ